MFASVLVSAQALREFRVALVPNKGQEQVKPFKVMIPVKLGTKSMLGATILRRY
jgi:hypothetical protein